jgi:hypothetical protein
VGKPLPLTLLRVINPCHLHDPNGISLPDDITKTLSKHGGSLCYRDNTPGDCWEARSSLLGGRQPDPSGAAGVIDYALSYGPVHVADICMTSRVYRETVALGPIVKIARNAGAATRV